jgi:phosphinothricin acetyltransferase
MDVKIRPATIADLSAINAIYNFYVITSTCTYQDEPSTDAERAQWFAAHGPEYPVTVALAPGSNGEPAEIVGWAALSRFHPRSAYRATVENSIYVLGNRRRQGIGRALLADLIQRATALRYHQIVALVSADQSGSLELHRRAGFTESGCLREVGRKFNQWLDVVYMQLPLEKNQMEK